MPPYRIRLVELPPHHTVFRIWRGTDPRFTEIRGRGYQEWTDGDAGPRCPAQRFHDGLTGPHASVLHAGDDLFVLDWHPDYDHVARWFDP